MQIARYLSVTCNQTGLDQSGHARTGFQVPYVGFDRTHQERAFRSPEHAPEGGCLHRISGGRAGSVGFHVAYLLYRHPAIRLFEQAGLPLHTRHGQALVAPVRIHHGAQGW